MIALKLTVLTSSSATSLSQTTSCSFSAGTFDSRITSVSEEVSKQADQIARSLACDLIYCANQQCGQIGRSY